MFWEAFINSLADFMGVSTTVAGFTMCAILTISVIIAILAATGGKNCELPMLVSSFIMVLLCTMFEWIAVWVPILYGLLIAVGVGWYLSRPARSQEG